MITKTTYKTRAEWEQYRNSQFFIGSSNVGTILGLSGYKTPLDVWTEWNTHAQSTNNNMTRGQFAEAAIAEWFENQTGLKVIKKSAAINVYRNSKYPNYIQVAPDRELFAEKRGERPILEIKDTRKYINWDESDTIPDEWFAQIQLQMAVMERKYAYLAISAGDKSLQYRCVEFAPDYAEKMISTAIAWVEKHIINGIQPDAINSDDVQKLYPITAQKTKRVPDEVIELYEQAKAADKAAKAAQKTADELKQRIITYFDDSDTLEASGRCIGRYPTIERKTFNAKKFAEDYPDVAKEYIVITNYRRFSF